MSGELWKMAIYSAAGSTQLCLFLFCESEFGPSTLPIYSLKGLAEMACVNHDLEGEGRAKGKRERRVSWYLSGLLL